MKTIMASCKWKPLDSYAAQSLPTFYQLPLLTAPTSPQNTPFLDMQVGRLEVECEGRGGSDTLRLGTRVLPG